jgi:hypothetical protein
LLSRNPAFKAKRVYSQLPGAYNNKLATNGLSASFKHHVCGYSIQTGLDYYQGHNELENIHPPGQSSSLALVRPHTLDRSAVDILLLVVTDVVMVLAWAGTLVYAALL